MPLPDLLIVAILTGAAIGLGYGLSVRKRLRSSAIAEDRPGAKYNIFTTEFDHVCSASQLDTLLETHAVNRGAPASASGASTEERYAQACKVRAERRVQCQTAERDDLPDCSVLVLLDQSGSMHDLMPRVAGEIFAALESLEESGAHTQLTGFTTVGWHGGQSRLKWIAQGKPPYPGRLCDLLLVKHCDFQESMKTADLAPIVQSNVLFENIDGEALLWGQQHLLEQPAKERVLVMISDGAPVDDSTIVANGDAFLPSHLRKVATGIESAHDVQLGAIGLNFMVDDIYRNAQTSEGAIGLGEDLVRLVNDLHAQI